MHINFKNKQRKIKKQQVYHSNTPNYNALTPLLIALKLVNEESEKGIENIRKTLVESFSV